MSWTVLDNRLTVREFPHLVQPVDPRLCDNSQALAAINNVRAVRAVMPATGTLMDLYVCIGTASGNVKGGVYDTGQTTNAVRTKLWEGASVPAVAGYLKLGDPSIAVRAGQHLDLAVQADNITVTVARATVVSSGLVLPYLATDLSPPTVPVGQPAPTPTVTARYGWQETPGGFALDAAIAEGTLVATGFLPLLVARIV